MYFVAVIYFLYRYLCSTALIPNFINHIRVKYGEVVVAMIRQSEKLTIKLQKCKCDLEFLRLCLIYDLTPTFVNINIWKTRLKSHQEFSTFKRYCIQQEYMSRQKDAIKREKALLQLLNDLEASIEKQDLEELKKYLASRSNHEKEKITEIHRIKLEGLNGGPVGQDYKSLANKLVHNISSYSLNPAEERLLCRGYNFCVENRITNFVNFKTDVEQNVLKLKNNCHSNVFSQICQQIYTYSEELMKTTKQKRIRNIGDDEFAAIKSLKDNPNIVICRADKGNAIVVMNKTDYIDKVENVLSSKQFKVTSKSLLKEKEEKLNAYLRQLYEYDNVLDKQLFYRIRSSHSSLAVMYGQPKVHKTGYPVRPIISSSGSYTHELSKYLAALLTRNRQTRSFSFIKDSFEFVKTIKNMNESKDQTMVSFDVDSLYTNVPVNEAIDIALDMLYKNKNNRTNPTVDLPFNRSQMKQLLKLAVCNVPFRFLDKYYEQCDGVAMGSPLAPILADLFMSKLEEKINKFSTNKPIIWLRYVDDIFCVFKTNQNIDDFLKRINKWHDNIKFTIETETNNQMPFLDVLIIRNSNLNKYDTTIYRKPTNTNLYLLYESNQCRRYKVGLIKSLVTRILLICSTSEYSGKEIKQMKETLSINGYPAHLVHRGIREGHAIVKRILNNTQSKTTDTKIPITNIFFTFSYYGYESTIFAERIKKICKRLLPLVRINIAFKKTFTLKDIFLPKQKGKDQDKGNKKLIYRIPCKDCDRVYYGETGREKTIRMKEHQTNIKKLKDTSELVQHILKEKHTFDFNNVDTISHETNWQRRVIKESLYTFESNGKAMNEVKHKLHVFG